MLVSVEAHPRARRDASVAIMAKLSDAQLKAILASQYRAAMAASSASKLSSEREQALSYYNGDLSKDLPTQPGRSSAVSMDVSDTIEGILPQLMEVFAGTDDVVKFEPVGPEDIQAAEQETDYVNHVFMNRNPGFMVLYSFIKDALLSKVGVVKVWYEKEERETKETYYGKSADEYALIAQAAESGVIEIVEHTANPDGTHDVTVVERKNYGCAKALGVPPEEFGIESDARSIRDCNYCYHDIVSNTEADLIDQGFDPTQVKALPTYRPNLTTEQTARDTVDESSASTLKDTGTRRVQIIEHYARLDYEDNGKAKLYRITTGGRDGPVLLREGKPDILEFDAVPFAAMTPVIVTHRFYGKSLADLVMDIARIKTALLRALLDNAYLANNRRVEVPESHANENTLDDLLVSRPGGIVRTKQPGGLREIDHTDIGSHVYPLLEYQDATREWRTGVTKQGQGIDANALQNQSATAVNQAFTASQARVRLIARIFAETGIKDLFWLLHATIKKHADEPQTVRLRNKWVPVDPRNWKTRDDLTVNVGLGTGSKESQLMTLQMLIGAQEKALQAGMVSKRNLWNSAVELVKVTGRKDPEAFFTDPSHQPDPQQPQDPSAAPIEPPPNPDMMKLQAESQIKTQEMQQKAQLDQQAMQNKAQIENVQAQADVATQDRKTQAEIALAREKFAMDQQLLQMEMQMKLQLHQQDMQMKQAEHERKLQQPEKTGASVEVKHNSENVTGPLAEIVGQMTERLAAMQAEHTKTLMSAMHAPKRVVRGSDGKVSHVETMN
jgi:hypothetical protein